MSKENFIELRAKPIKESLFEDLKKRSRHFLKSHLRKPKIVVVLVGNDPASCIYVANKEKTADLLELDHETIKLSGSTTKIELESLLKRLNLDDKTDGILVQRPVPIAGLSEEGLSFLVAPEKDVDCFHPENLGRVVLGLEGLAPCTPMGIIRILDYYSIPLAGKSACVVGRSAIVGKPMAALLLNRNATVIQCHSHTHDLAHYTQQANILIVAAGKPHLIDDRHIAKGTVVIDVGMHRSNSGTLHGDVNFDAVKSKVHSITPVPGGVGPMTIAQLMENTLTAAERRASKI